MYSHRPYLGWKLVNWCLLSEVSGSWTYHLMWGDWRMPKKPETGDSIVGKPTGAVPGTVLKKFPTLMGYLCDATWEGTDEKREFSYLIIRPGATYWSAILKDPATCAQLKALCSSWDDVLPTLEGLLASKSCPWEADPYANGSGFKKPKRGG